MSILLTGAAGFIGHHVARALLDRGERVVGVDNLNDYYDVRLKRARLARLAARPGFCFHPLDIADRAAMEGLAAAEPGITAIVHLAAQAGVRSSMVAPYAYAASNLMGHLVVLETARHLRGLRHLVYASSSSVYGANRALPFAEADRVDTPLSLYAATKRADELMSHAYGHLYGLPQTGLRFFTVYGPWGRPDMAYFSFAEAILRASRSRFTTRAGRSAISPISMTWWRAWWAAWTGRRRGGGAPPVRLLNIGNHRAETVATLIALLEQALGRRAVRRLVPRPAADVAETCAAVDAIGGLTGFAPRTPLSVGIPRFAAWFLEWRAGLAGGAGAMM